MRESGFKLNDKTIVLSGALNSLSQSLIMSLTEQGSNVGFITTAKPDARRFIDNISDAREIHSSYGRALMVDMNLKGEAIGKVAESFGSIDSYIDISLLQKNSGTDAWDVSHQLVETAMPFFIGRKRGHIIFLLQDKQLQADEKIFALVEQYIQEKAKTFKDKNLTANALALGVTEEFLLFKYPKAGSIKNALIELNKEIPHARLLDSTEIASAVTFLASPLSSGINGQTLYVTGGL